jgi:predicted nucleotidyltransferase
MNFRIAITSETCPPRLITSTVLRLKTQKIVVQTTVVERRSFRRGSDKTSNLSRNFDVSRRRWPLLTWSDTIWLMRNGSAPFDRSVAQQIALNRARTPTERFQAMCALLDAARAMAPKDSAAQERRRRALASREPRRLQWHEPTHDDTLPPEGLMIQQAFEALIDTLSERGIRYAVIGGIAAIQYSRVRTTDDVDVLVAVPQISLAGLFEALRDRGFDVDVTRNIRQFRDHGLTTVRYRQVLVDLMRPILPAYAHVLDRAIDASIFGRTVRVSSAEGLIVTKLISARPQDETDIRDLLASYSGKLDLAYVRSEMDAIMSATDSRRMKFEEWVRQANQNP